jgi:hypothetical protein
MRQEAEIASAKHLIFAESNIKSVPNKPLPQHIDGLRHFVILPVHLHKICKTLRPSTEIWTTMRAVAYLFVCFFDLVVRNNPLMIHAAHLDEATGVVSESSTLAALDNGSVGSGAQQTDNGTQDLVVSAGATKLIVFWKNFVIAMHELRITKRNFCNSFTWEFILKMLGPKLEFLHIMGDIEKGEITTPKILASDRLPKSSAVNWRSGHFYHDMASDDHTMGTLRVLAGNACFTPASTYKSTPYIASLCQWARHVISGIFAGKMIQARAGTKFPKVNVARHLDPHEAEHKFDDGMSIISDGRELGQSELDSQSVASSVLVNALRNISATVPGSEEEYLLATGDQYNIVHSKEKKPKSPQRRIGHFIETSTLQSSVLHVDVSDDVLASVNSTYMTDKANKVPHQANTHLDGDSELHVVAYMPALRFPDTLHEVEEAKMEINLNVAMVALSTARPCDRVEVLVGAPHIRKSKKNEAPFNQEIARQCYAELVLAKTASPLHRVLVAPYATGSVAVPKTTATDSPIVSSPLTKKTTFIEAEALEPVRTFSFKKIRATSRPNTVASSSGIGVTSTGSSTNTATVTSHSIVDKLLVESVEFSQYKDIVESREDDMYEYLAKVQEGVAAVEASAHADTSIVVHKSHTVVFIKDLHQIFSPLSDSKLQKLPKVVMLAPPRPQHGLQWPVINQVSRYVVCIGDTGLSRSAFQTTIRLSKLGDLVFLVHVIKRSDEITGEGQRKANQLAAEYQGLGFNLHVAPESQLIPPGPDESLQFCKALVACASMHNPTHMVLGADKSEINFSFFQNSLVDDKPSVVSGVIRHEKYLSKLNPEFSDISKQRPVLVLTDSISV